MNQDQSAHLAATLAITFSICLNLLLIIHYCETRRVLRWYRDKYFSTPRVIKCPHKYSVFSKAVLFLLTLKPLK
jgi:hypothetical protein